MAVATSPGGRALAGRILYGLLFVAAFPAALVLWARAGDRWLTAPGLRAPAAGAALVVVGVALVLWGWTALWLEGGGLPMNAYPPPRRATGGPYRLVSHPVYTGFCAAVLGAALWSGSPAALWLVTPGVCLAAAALVLGHERLDLLRRLGPGPRPLLALPPRGTDAPPWRERLGAALLVLPGWLAAYEITAAVGPWGGAPSTVLGLERAWPVLPAAEPIYASVYLVVPLAFALAPTRDALRALARDALVASAVAFPFYLLVPLVAPVRPLEGAGLLAAAVRLERSLDTPGCALPSFHVIWAALAARALAPRTRLAWPWAALLAASCAAVGAHGLLDLAAGGLLALAIARGGAIWAALRGLAERIANSWWDVRLGPVRVINHGAWVGLGTAAGLGIAAGYLGPEAGSAVALLWACGILGAGAWAQAIEGRGLSRPFGFYGGLIGLGLGGALAPALGLDAGRALAAVALGGPACQALGRLRCLVQGCCHGAPAPAPIGIRFRHPLSRVTRAGLGGVPVHPTQLYSILWNLAAMAVPFRAAALGAPAYAIVGLYLFLGGVGRFVEEAYRGEPQTPAVAGLRLYQWLAVGCAVAGAALTALGSGAPLPAWRWDAGGMLAASLAGLGSAVAMGVDFPGSSRRLSRLA